MVAINKQLLCIFCFSEENLLMGSTVEIKVEDDHGAVGFTKESKSIITNHDINEHAINHHKNTEDFDKPKGVL